MNVGNCFSASISGNNGRSYQDVGYGIIFNYVGAFKNGFINFGKPTKISGNNNLHYYLSKMTGGVCDVVIIYSNGDLYNYNGSNPPSDVWLENFNQVTFVKNDNSVYQINLGNIIINGNAKSKAGNCKAETFTQWYANPSIVKEIRLHN